MRHSAYTPRMTKHVPAPLAATTADPILWADENEWIVPPLQQRSRASLEKILRTATALFIEPGFEETTVGDIARASGVSVGSIYKRFGGKQAILLAILEGYRRARFEQITDLGRPERWIGRSAVDIVNFHIEIIFSAFRNDAGILRLLERQRIVNPTIYDQTHAGNELVSTTIARLLQPHAASIAHTDIEAAVRFIHNIIRGAIVWASTPTTQRPDAPLQVESDACKDEARTLALGYLGLAAPSPMELPSPESTRT